MKKVQFKQEGNGFKLGLGKNDMLREDNLNTSDYEQTSKLVDLGLICPLSKQILRDPVTLSTGISYERKAIEKWLTQNNTCPVTGQKLKNPVLNTNYNLRQKVYNWALNNKPSLIDREKWQLKPLHSEEISFKSEFGAKSYSNSANNNQEARLPVIQDENISNPLHNNTNKDLDGSQINQINTSNNQSNIPNNERTSLPSPKQDKFYQIPLMHYFGPGAEARRKNNLNNQQPRDLNNIQSSNQEIQARQLDSVGTPINQREFPYPPTQEGYSHTNSQGYNYFGNSKSDRDNNNRGHQLYSNTSNGAQKQQDIDRDMAYAVHLQDQQNTAQHNQMQPPYGYNGNNAQYQNQNGYNNQNLYSNNKSYSHYDPSQFTNHQASRYTILAKRRQFQWIIQGFFISVSLAFILGQVFAFYFNSWRPVSLVQQPLIGAGPIALQQAGAIRVNQFYIQNPGNFANVNSNVGNGTNIITRYDSKIEWYTILTSLWLFSGVYQLVVGLSSMWLCVKHLSYVLDWWKIIGLFIISGIVGNMATMVFAPQYASAGAPSLVFGLIGALFSDIIYHCYLYKNILLTTLILLFELGVNIVINLPPSGNIWGGIFAFLVGALLCAIGSNFLPDKRAIRTSKGIIIIVGKAVLIAVSVAIIAMIIGLFGSSNLLGARKLTLQDVQCSKAAWWDCTQGLSLNCVVQHNSSDTLTMSCLNQAMSQKYPISATSTSLTQQCVTLCSMKGKTRAFAPQIGNNPLTSTNPSPSTNPSNGGGGFVPASQLGSSSNTNQGAVPLPNQIVSSNSFVPAKQK